MVPLIGLPALDFSCGAPVDPIKYDNVQYGDENHYDAFDKKPMPTIETGGRNAPQPRPKFLLENFSTRGKGRPRTLATRVTKCNGASSDSVKKF
jgi:hypothetical protein